MSDTVVPIEANQPHLAEPAQCRSCRHCWVAVIIATANPWLLECPACGRMRGHIPHAQPESPYQAKVWAEEMWRYWYEGVLPGSDVTVLCESQGETDGSAESAASTSTSGGSILTVAPSRWITSSRCVTGVETKTTTCAQPTSGATTEEDLGATEHIPAPVAPGSGVRP